MQAVVAAAVEKQGLVVSEFVMFDVADVEGMVACGMDVDDAGDEMGQGPLDYGHVVLIDEREFQALLQAAREVIAKGILPFGQNADAEVAGGGQQRIHRRAIIHGDDNERRIERDGHESIGRHAVRAFSIARSDNRHAAGEAAERVAEMARIEGLLGSVGSGFGRVGRFCSCVFDGDTPGRPDPALSF